MLTQRGDEAVWLDYGVSEERAFGSAHPSAPLAALAHLHERWRTAPIPGHPPLTGGLIGFIGWEAIRQIERLPNIPPQDFFIPGQALSFVSELVVVDHTTGSVLLIAAVLNDGGADPGELWAGAQERLDRMQERLAQPSEAWLAKVDLSTVPTPVGRVTSHDFRDSVERAKRHIRDGDVFQVVLSQRFDHEITADPIDVYRVLRTLNPSPYMYLLSLVDGSGEPYWIVGSSPEALVKVEAGRVYMHPIAGSRPRGSGPEEDQQFAEDLLADPRNVPNISCSSTSRGTTC